MGTLGHGTTFEGTTLGTIAKVKNISWSGFECDEIDISSMDSTDMYREFIGGMINAGELSFGLIYVKASVASLIGAVGVIDSFTVTFPDGATLACSGFAKAPAEIEDEFEGAIEVSVTIKLTGKPTFTAGA